MRPQPAGDWRKHFPAQAYPQIDHICISHKFRRSWRDGCVMRCGRVIRPPSSPDNSETQHTGKVQRRAAQEQRHTGSIQDQPFQQIPAATRLIDPETDIETHWEHNKKIRQEEGPAQGLDLCQHHPQARQGKRRRPH